MRTILDECQDSFGMCIRQYITAGFLLLIFLISLWSCYKTFRKRHIQPKFQLIPLSLNMLVTLLMLCLQIIYEEYYNTHLIFMLVQFFSYYLLTYALVYLYVKGAGGVKRKLDDRGENGTCVNALLGIMGFRCGTKRLTLGFAVGSFVILAVTVGVTILSFLDFIKCTQQYWISTLVLLILQIPFYIVTTIYCSRTKKQIKSINQKKSINHNAQSTMHLFKQEDSYIKLKILQTNLFQITFTLSILLHIAELITYQFMEESTLCIEETNEIEVRNAIELSIMVIKNMSEIVPHLMILLIFWIIPEKTNRQAPVSLYVTFLNDMSQITPKLINPKLQSKFDDDDEQIHRKLIY